MRITFGLALIIWGLLVLFVLPDALPNKFANYTILGLYIMTIGWWLAHEHLWWSAYWFTAAGITAVVTFGDLSIK